jgi:protein-S-isoprenylcysteine O-methyltransferase Ste14
MYLADVAMALGWIVFYGSIVLLAIFVGGALSLGPFVMSREEQGLEAMFGDAYVKYRCATPRWMGRVTLGLSRLS